MKVLGVFAHPDDETFGCGGTLAQLSKKGATVKIITATKGEEGSVGKPPLCKKEELGMVREQELLRAAKTLGIKDVYFLGYHDGTLENIQLEEISTKVLKILRQEHPDIVITFNREGDSRHPDHIQINKAATLAFKYYMQDAQKHVRLYYIDMPKSLLKKLEKIGTIYTAFGTIQGTPDEDITTIIDVSDTIEKKVKAFLYHQTQHKDWERFLKRKHLPEFTREFFTLALENSPL